MTLNNILRKYKVFQEQRIGSRQRLNIKGLKDYNKKIKRQINK